MLNNRPSSPARRRFLGTAAAAGGALAISAALPGQALAAPAHLHSTARLGIPRPFGTLFTLGVASGEPTPNSVVIWTRLAPDPLAPRGGLGNRGIRVEWQVATDPDFVNVRRQGFTTVQPSLAWTAHVTVQGLDRNREYWYRFRADGDISPVGRTKTLPGALAPVTEMRFAHVSCNDYQHGEWGAFNGLADENLDYWVHVGDYIYEYGPNPAAARQHDGDPTDSIETLEQYRNRYALYRMDPALQAAHASAPMFWVPDDHEVENNHAGLIDEEETGFTTRFRSQRVAAFRAAWEHMPMARFQRPEAAGFQLFRDFRYGTLAQVSLLDTRQYRTDQEGGDGILPRPSGLDPEGDILGARQESWLQNRLVSPNAGGRATWNVIAQQMVMTRTAFGTPTADGVLETFNMDAWDGYVASRERLLNYVDDAGVKNLVTLAGDIHSTWISDLCTDFDRPDETVIGSEFVGTGISSDFPGQFVPFIEASLPLNPNVKYFNAGKAVRESTADEHHGYLSHRVTPDAWHTDVRQVANIDDPNAPMSTVASFQVTEGQPGPQRV